MQLRVGIRDETALVREDRPNCAIVHPDEPAGYASLVARIQEAIAGVSRVTIPAHKDTDVVSSKFDVAEELTKKNLILLGNVNTNRAFVRLAANFFVYSTCQWPGENGCELRTVTNPYGTKTNCIVMVINANLLKQASEKLQVKFLREFYNKKIMQLEDANLTMIRAGR